MHRVGLALLCVLGALRATLHAQDLVIEHDPLECLASAEHPVVDSFIRPGEAVQTARVYFRADQFNEYYYVDLKLPEGADPELYLGLLPMPSPETRAIVYYVEAVDATFTSTRSEEIQAPVNDPCARRPAAAYFTGDPGITVGATAPGATAVPPGFRAAGIVGFISAVGVASGAGGGIGVGLALGVGAAAAGGAAVAVVATGGENDTPPTMPPTPPTGGGSDPPPTPASPTPNPGPTPPRDPSTLRACYRTVPNPPLIPPGMSVSFDASCSTGTGLTYSWDFGLAGPMQSGATVSQRFGTEGSFRVVLTVVDASGGRDSFAQTVTVREGATPPMSPGPPLDACFMTTVMGCTVSFDASCSTGSIIDYSWNIDDGGALGGPFVRSGMMLSETFPGCNAETLDVTLTVDDGAAADIDNQLVTLPAAGASACFTANVNGCDVNLDASCSTGPIMSYTWDIDDGGVFGGPFTRSGSVRNDRFVGCNGETLDITLTVDTGTSMDSTSQMVTLGFDMSPVTACFTYQGRLATCVHRWSAACSSGSIDQFEWRVDTGAQLPAGTLSFNNPLPDLIVDWNPMGGCAGSPAIDVELTVRSPTNQTDTTSMGGFVIDQKSPEREQALTTTFSSVLRSSEGASGLVLLNGVQSDAVDSGQLHRHRLTGRAGRNLVEATLTSASDPTTQWRFDFSDAEHFQRGSLRVERGQLLTATEHYVVFRLARGRGERIRFWFQLAP